jgi:hypothetical protein
VIKCEGSVFVVLGKAIRRIVDNFKSRSDLLGQIIQSFVGERIKRWGKLCTPVWGLFSGGTIHHILACCDFLCGTRYLDDI